VQAAQEQYAHLPLPPPPPLPPPAAQQPLPPPPPLPQRLPSPPHEAQPAPARGMTAAQRMMEKMGWREGQNLGKSEPTRVLCLRGMVGRGEVDEALEDEVADECEKHGPVVRVLIFEVTDAACPPDAAVRIFVQFVKLEGAVKALAEMDGRFFGGRVVRASFYSEARFDAQDIAPAPGDYT
jgi:splicing factor 45